MKRITNISIDNYKAYIVKLDIPMPNGENVLIYGENGSGKSSLYKALRYFLSSSVNGSDQFDLNRFSGRKEGKIVVSYSDIDANGSIINGSETPFVISTDVSLITNVQPFIQISHRSSGFLDYAVLLQAYLHRPDTPNLYSLVISLLANFVPTAYGCVRSLGEDIKVAQRLMKSSYHRSDNMYIQGHNDFLRLQNVFPHVINDLNAVLTPMMHRYFHGMNLEVRLVGATLLLIDDKRIQDAEIKGEVFVEVRHHGTTLQGYNTRLNEARLSAIAICLYLSSLKMMAVTNDTKILFLDDVFIGLDLGNRIPVLNIIRDQFQDFQQIITTYDKSWFNQAKEVLESMGNWAFYEMYEGTLQNAAGQTMPKPILVNSDSDLGKAYAYSHNEQHPDYPASANYLRKSFEKLLQCDFYDRPIRDDNYEIIPAFKLTKLVYACRKFISQIPDYYVPQINMDHLLNELYNLLHPLLHPLSHYVPDTPIYKLELMRALKVYDDIKAELEQCHYEEHCRVVLDQTRKIEFTIDGATGWKDKYVLRLSDNLYQYDDIHGGRSLSSCEMKVVYMEGIDTAGKRTSQHITAGSNTHLIYNGIQDCHDKIINYIRNNGPRNDIVVQKVTDMFVVPDQANNLHSLTDVIANIVW